MAIFCFLAFAAPALAADAGGACCADLEQRVAELDATTARKGNRKMSVTLSGQVNRAVMWWDDGDESNAYVVDNDYASSRFNLSGEAEWKPGWSVGFVLEWEQVDDASNAVDANTDDVESGLVNRMAYWWMKSDRLGSLSVGQVETATDGTSEANLSGATDFAGNSIQSNNAAFALVRGGGLRSELLWGDVSPDNLSGLSRQQGVRYDSPEVMGFALAAGWYEDDMWDVALRYDKELNSVQLAAAIGYAEDREGGGIGFCASGPSNAPNGGGSQAACSQVSASASILHQPSGLFASLGAGWAQDDNRQSFALANGVNADFHVDNEARHIYANVGIYRRFNSHGKTSFGIEYYDGACGFGSCGGNFGNAVDGVGFVAGSEVEMIGGWIAQEIDCAATTFYLDYHHFEGGAEFNDPTGDALPAPAYKDMYVVKAGAIVRF